MIKLRINDITGNVCGYAYVQPGEVTYRTDILIDDDAVDWDILSQGMTKHDAYYENGTIVRKEMDSFQSDEIDSLEQLLEAKSKVDAEYKMLMDHLLSGIRMEEAMQIAKSNREELERLQTSHKLMIERHEKELFDFQAEKNREKVKDRKWKYYSAAVLLIRDENKYLEEWITWHLHTGFDHIYIYDNGETQAVADVIPDAASGKITVVPWHGSFKNVQADAYNHFLEHHGADCRWVNFIDSDEFIRFVNPEMTVNAFLSEYEDYTEIHVGFVEYNASGQESYEDAPVRERFKETMNKNSHLYHKDFVQPHRVDFMDRHYPKFGERGNYTFKNNQDNKDVVVIDHYYTKSWEEWQEKMMRGSSDPHYLKQTNEFFVYNPDMAHLKSVNEVQKYRN